MHTKEPSTFGEKLIEGMQSFLDDPTGCKVTRVVRNEDGTFTHTECRIAALLSTKKESADGPNCR